MKQRPWMLLLCAACLWLSVACQQLCRPLECQVTDTPQVQEKDGALWLDVPIPDKRGYARPLSVFEREYAECL